MALRRFLLIFAILFLTPIIGHAATCTSTETVTKCAKIPTEIYVEEYESTFSAPCTFIYKDVVYSGNKPILSGGKSTCTINSPLNANVDGDWRPTMYDETLFSWSSFSFTSKLDGDICPDGFYTVPYNVSCGAGMVDTANVPNCSDDTSGESCLIPATSAPAPEYKFTATIDLSLYADNKMGFEPITEFGFNLGAAGTFYVDWGDGTTETIEKDNTDAVTYTHDYGTTSGTYTVKIGGLATDYSDDESAPAISFGTDAGPISFYTEAITAIFGSLGAIFPTLLDGSQPRFTSLFYSARITEIPSGLFDGIHGAPVSDMFAEAFGGCSLLTSIPENLFAGITGAAEGMFYYTFFECSGLTSIPENLFSGITGAAEDMFSSTFSNSGGLTSIPENLFSGITGAAEGMFDRTFAYCRSLTGPSARINGKYLYELWPDNVADWGSSMYYEATGLDDYACIPTVMGGGGETCAPAPEYKFTATIDLSLYEDNLEGMGMPVTEFGFDLGAAGTFYVDWGDGTTETIEKDNTDAVTYTHDYGTTSGTYTVKIGGMATNYSDNEDTPAISFDVEIFWSSVFSQAITEISGSLGAIFPTLSDGSQPRFPGLFYDARFAEIPSGLFDGIHGTPVSKMFFGAFSYNDNLTGIPENLFSGIVGSAPHMFSHTFEYCSGLTNIPENLFSGITGNAPHMFSVTFGNCGNLTSIPENLFSGITGAAEYMFADTFASCSKLTGPSARINGKYLYELWPDNIAEWGPEMYDGSTGLSDYACIPTVMGGGGETCAPAPEYKFTATTTSNTSRFDFAISAAGTFYVDWGDGNTETIEKPDTTDTTYSHNYSTKGKYIVKIGGLATAYNSSRTVASISFANSALGSIDGSLGAIFPTLSDGSQPSFFGTFATSYELTSIPENLFSGITGNAPHMFAGTFSSCPNLTSIPENLFSGITGAAEYMFADTFSYCSKLTSIPENLFSGITGNAPYMFGSTFSYCSKLTGPSARINGKYLYELWPDNVAYWGYGMYNDSTGLSDYACIPTVMGGGGETCEPAPEYKFSITIDLSLYDDNFGKEKITKFAFELGAAGTFYVDWGDGTTETIEKDNTDMVAYLHDYGTTSGTYTVQIGGLATEYSDDEYTPVISTWYSLSDFADTSHAIVGINGSLGAIFPTLSDGSQPRFYNSFENLNITEIPANLFDGIHGAPVSYMFANTFNFSTITNIPENLFSGITGAAEGMFSGTFSNSGLTSIPENLFSGITGAAEGMFYETFMNTPITSIPENLFSGITGVAEGMFYETFMNTTITRIPENLFRGITGAAEYMFNGTFHGCFLLTGPSARINGKYLYELWPDNIAEWGFEMYYSATGLDDYAYIPVIMGGLGQVREQLCAIGISQIKISTGVSFALYAEKYTQPTLAIKYNDGICYGKLEQGNQSGTINFNYNGAVYHLAN